MLYVLVVVWLNAHTGLPENMKRMEYPPAPAEDCVQLQMKQSPEHPVKGQIKIYGCVPQYVFGETSS